MQLPKPTTKTYMDPPISPHDGESSPLSSALSNPDAYFTSLQRAKDRIAAYSPLSPTTTRDDYTKSLLTAILDNEKVIGRSGIITVVEDILDVQELGTLAEHYMTCVYFPLRARGNSLLPTPRPLGLDDVDEISSELDSQRRRSEMLKEACLARDGGKCIVTGAWQEGHSNTPSDGLIASTQAVHIIPFSLGNFTEDKRASITRTWDAIYRMFPDIRTRINFRPNHINDTRNVMTMDRILHPEFGEFRFCFLATETPHRYKIKKYKVTHGVNRLLPEYVTFTAHSGLYELPSPQLLRLHAAVAGVLFASGLGEYMNEMIEDRDEIRVLAEDGSTPVSRLLLAVH